ncbi:Acyl-CoA dehydrogenase family member 9, mitochondrial [Trichinella nelsoni]|uniref:Acyl-CoA dehydrogenase family member 9, mitochondrial n=1 Tax=Trichinella nelsoni TaxID=6336 RepID=A0A0V0RNV7_9BILA|nr:Acyl-CoA dehydrogenase family member 9, mitochondrial [Trichinella nelsoni]KRX16130.1 Acyl-CoA dehydrogenase family member 9, mitochondrial [Trichinella nelsoni]
MVFSRRIHQCIKSKLLMRNNFLLFINNRNEYCLKSKKLEASKKTDIDKALPLHAIETSSVAKGLFCNRVDKSMLIYPEFEETEDLTDVEKFAGRFASIYYFDLGNFVEWDKNRCIPEEVKFSLKKVGLYSMSVPQQYGGLNLNNKAKSRIYAELGCDLTLFASAFVQNELICETLKMFGSEEQKRTYLPMLATGDISGAFCLHEHACGQDIAAMRTESVENCHGPGFKLNGQKSWVTNGALADLLVVFAKVQSKNSDQKVFSDPSGHLSVFLVDRRKIEGLNVTKRQNTIGLRGLEIVDLVFEDVIVPETAILGNESAGFDIANSIVGSSRSIPMQIVTEMNSLDVASQHCNKRKSYGRPLSESNFIRERLANLAMHVYILETMAFYIAGHLDSDSSKDFTVEGSIAQLLSRKYLREGIVSVMEIFGASAATTDEEFERLLRDVTTFSSFMNTDDWLVGYIATSGLAAWAQSRAMDLHKIGRPNDYPWHVVKSRWLSRDVYRGSFSFQHYLHEHLHPSLMDACRFIEEVMCKFDHIIRNQLKLKQKDIEEDSFALKRFCDVGCYLFAMVVAVSRASRSYCIGLKNGDLEVYMAHALCSALKTKSLHALMELTNGVNGPHNEDLMKVKIATAVSHANGYPIVSPLERNCDPAMKQFLLHLDEKMLIGFKFIIRDIDETHVFITSEAVSTLMQRIDALMESLSPDVAEKS